MKLPLGKLHGKQLEDLVFQYLPLADRKLGKRLDFSIDPHNKIVVASDPIIGIPLDYYGFFAAHYSTGDVVLSGASPRYLNLGIYYPPGTSSIWLKKNMKALGNEVCKLDVEILGGHTGAYEGLALPLISTTCIGFLEKPALDASNISVNDDIIISGPVNREFAWFAAHTDPSILLPTIPKRQLEELKSSLDLLTITPLAKRLISLDPNFMHDATEGGLATAFLEISNNIKRGIQIEYDKIPWDPFGLKIITALNADPMSTSSFGSLIIICSPNQTQDITAEITKFGRPAAIVGKILKKPDIIIKRKDSASDLKQKPDPYGLLVEKYKNSLNSDR